MPPSSVPLVSIPLAELPQHVGTTLGASDWLTIDQAMIDAFADATGDHQWIHVDPVRAADGPFGGTIAHGYLTVSLLPRLLSEVYTVTGVSTRINYGMNRLRFPTPVPSGSRIRAVAELVDVDPAGSTVTATVRATVELEGASKPACVADLVVRLVPDEA